MAYSQKILKKIALSAENISSTLEELTELAADLDDCDEVIDSLDDASSLIRDLLSVIDSKLNEENDDCDDDLPDM